MDHSPPILHMMCGKIAAGKSTLALKLAADEQTVLVSEDDWLAPLFGDELSTLSDYARCASRLRQVMGPHITSLLDAGVSVVLDFPANTVENRQWMRSILDATACSHQLHILTTPDEVCLSRLQERNARGDHPFAATEQQFHQISKYYVPPVPEEGFNLVYHRDPS